MIFFQHVTWKLDSPVLAVRNVKGLSGYNISRWEKSLTTHAVPSYYHSVQQTAALKQRVKDNHELPRVQDWHEGEATVKQLVFTVVYSAALAWQLPCFSHSDPLWWPFVVCPGSSPADSCQTTTHWREIQWQCCSGFIHWDSGYNKLVSTSYSLSYSCASRCRSVVQGL